MLKYLYLLEQAQRKENKMDEKKNVNEAAKALSKLGASKGGVARAKSLTPEVRSAIARQAVETRWEREGKTKILKATHIGKLDLVGRQITCAVLEGGIRVISERSIAKAFGKKGGGAYWKKKKLNEEGALLPEYISAQNLEPFISPETKKRLLNPVPYISKSGVKSNGMPATILQEICEIWLKARDSGALSYSQETTANNAEILMRGFATLGIIALVDEATGYEKVRDKLALSKILEIYIAKELRPWLKTFPDEFYEHLFRLRGWQYNPLSVSRPGVVGKITNDLIYKRLAPGILEELKSKTQRDDKGRPRHKYFQLLTEDIGNPKLREHLASVTTLMKVSNNWDTFYQMMQRALPQYGETYLLPFTDEEIDKFPEH